MAREAAIDDATRIIVKHGVCPPLRVRESLAVLLDEEKVSTDFAILDPSGKSLPLPGTPAR